MSTRILPSLSPRSRCSSSARSRSSAPMRPRSMRSFPSGVAAAVKLEFLLREKRSDLRGAGMAVHGVEELLLLRRKHDAVRQAALILPVVAKQKRLDGHVLIGRQTLQGTTGVGREAAHGFLQTLDFARLAVVHRGDLFLGCFGLERGAGHVRAEDEVQFEGK